MARKLKCQTNTTTIEQRVTDAFAVSDFPCGDGFESVFEHGQWWINCDNGAQYSVVDASGGQSIDGFDFEEITPPSDY